MARNRTGARLGAPAVILVVLEFFFGIMGLVSGAWLAFDPHGGMGMGTDVLQGSPFSSFLAPGIILFFASGVIPIAVAVAALRRASWAWIAHFAVGAVLLGWIVIEYLLLGYLGWLQPFILVASSVILILAFWNLRRSLPGRPRG